MVRIHGQTVAVWLFLWICASAFRSQYVYGAAVCPPLLNVVATTNAVEGLKRERGFTVAQLAASETVPVIVDGKAPEPDFDISRIDLTPIATAGFQSSVTFLWWFANDTSCTETGSSGVEFAGSFEYSSSWVLSAYPSLPPVPGLEVTMPDSEVIKETTVPTVTGLQSSGTSFANSQETALSFDVTVECDADFIAAVELRLAYAYSYSGIGSDIIPPSVATFALRWQCAARGCLAWCGDLVDDCYDYCGEHGVCNHDAGTCICDSGWVGPFCGLVLGMPESMCPNELLFLNYVIPPTIVGYPRALELLWTGLKVPSDLFYTEWHYFVTGCTACPDVSDPIIDIGLNGSGYVLTPLRPAIYRLIVASDADTSRDYYIKYFIVSTWEECGFELCSVGGNNTCNSDKGWGACKSGICSCSQGRYWNDCSRGCSKYNNITTKSGQIQNDFPPSGLTDDMLYANSANCNWLITPGSGTDVITLNFTYVWMDPADTLSVYLVGADGDTGDLLTTISSPGLLTVLASEVIVQLRSDYEAASHGFILTYASESNPLLNRKETAIVVSVAAAVGTIAILSIGISASCYIVRRRRRILRAQQNAPAEPLPDDEVSQAIRRSLTEVNKDLKKSNMELNKISLNFGVSEGGTCEVMQKLTDELILKNNGGQPVIYCFYVPRIPHKLEFNMCPGQGRVPPHRELKISVEVKLLLTTRIESNIKLEILREGNTTATLLPFRIEGMVSTRLDPDEIMLNHTPLAAGAFGSVFQGIYRSQLVAAKVLKHQEAFFEKEYAEFEAECTLLKQLRHPNIVGFVGASYVTGKLCICTEFMDMGSLERYLQSDQDILYALILKFALNTAEAMAFIHSNKILYRDLKCSNILLVSDNLTATVNCKLSDFGTSRSVEDPEEIIRRTSGKGTAIYMAPELLGHLPYNSKVDVFSFGICLWEMWYRIEPWEELMCWDVPKTVMAGNRPPIDDDIPIEYSTLMKQCWEQDCNARPDFKKIAATLANLYNSEKSQVDDLRKKQEEEEKKKKRRRRRRHDKKGSHGKSKSPSRHKGKTKSHSKSRPRDSDQEEKALVKKSSSKVVLDERKHTRNPSSVAKPPGSKLDVVHSVNKSDASRLKGEAPPPAKIIPSSSRLHLTPNASQERKPTVPLLNLPSTDERSTPGSQPQKTYTEPEIGSSSDSKSGKHRHKERKGKGKKHSRRGRSRSHSRSRSQSSSSSSSSSSSRSRSRSNGKSKSKSKSSRSTSRSGSKRSGSKSSSYHKHHHRIKKTRTKSEIRIVKSPSKIDLGGFKKSASKLDLNLDTSEFIRSASRVGNQEEDIRFHKTPDIRNGSRSDLLSAITGVKKSASKPDLSSATPLILDEGHTGKKPPRRILHRAAMSNTVEMSILKHGE
ncbi:Serine/threonine-protein kinase STY46 [Pelomyxa schiedti]|nr:Serine/threonine-protein kinase STY46 [Pelomyxa schiedti]